MPALATIKTASTSPNKKAHDCSWAPFIINYCLATLKCLGTAYNLKNFLGNGCLSGAVVHQLELL